MKNIAKYIANTANYVKNLWNDPFFRRLIVAFIIIKLFILTMGLIGDASFPLDKTHQKNVTQNQFLNAWAQYDGAGYLDLAVNGYDSKFNNTGNYSVYPFYPLLIFVLALLPFISPALSAFIISNIFSLIAIILLYLLVKDELGRKKSYRTAILLMLFPTAYFLTAMYTESLFLAFIVGMFLAAKKENWLIVGVLGFAASLTRIQGFLMIFPMLYMYLQSKGFSFRKINLSAIKPDILFLFFIPLGLLALLGYHGIITGDPLMQFHYGFGIYDKGLSLPWDSIADAIEKISFSIKTSALDGLLYNSANLLMFLFLASITYLCYKKLKAEYSIYLLLNIIFILISSNLRGIGRYILIMFPVFMILSMMYEQNRIKKYALITAYAVFIIIMSLFIFRHVNQGIYLTFNYMIF